MAQERIDPSFPILGRTCAKGPGFQFEGPGLCRATTLIDLRVLDYAVLPRPGLCRATTLIHPIANISIVTTGHCRRVRAPSALNAHAARRVQPICTPSLSLTLTLTLFVPQA